MRGGAIEVRDNLDDEPRSMYDVNFDAEITPLDALLVINFINANGLQALAPDDPILDFDINNDGQVTPLDVLLIMNETRTSKSSGVAPTARIYFSDSR